MTNKDKDLEIVLLTTTNNDYELLTIKTLLEDNNIPYILKDKETGGYMRIIGGTSIYGTDILVEKSAYEKAKNILGNFPWGINE